MAKLIINGRGEEREVLPETVKQTISWTPSEPQEQPSWREYAEEGVRRQRFDRESDPSHRRELFIDTPTDRYIANYWSGDWHVGGEGFMFKEWAKDMDLLLNTPDISLILMGDESDNFWWLPGAGEQLFTPHQQMAMLNGLFRELLDKDKIKARVGGNHTDEWLWKNAGIEFMVAVMGFNGVIPLLREGGYIHERVGSQVYHYLARHRTRYNSSLNMFHGNTAAYRREGKADVVVSGHTHDLGAGEMWLATDGVRKEMHNVKSGTYKQYDRWIAQQGGVDGSAGGAVTIHSPFEREIFSTTTLEKGVKLLQALNYYQDQALDRYVAGLQQVGRLEQFIEKEL